MGLHRCSLAISLTKVGLCPNISLNNGSELAIKFKIGITFLYSTMFSHVSNTSYFYSILLFKAPLQ